MSKCIICHKIVQANKKGRQRKICSDNHCRYLRAKYRDKHYCPTCGKLIAPSSKTCPKHMPQLYGIEADNWKGGRTRHDGYNFIHKPSHPRATATGYVREHLLVWEESHGKPLPKGWIVHHLNGIRDDNRPKNLIGLPNLKHQRILQAKAQRIQELEALLNGQCQLL